MVAKSLTNGKDLTSMLVTGKTIKKKVSVFNIMPTEISTKEDGPKTNVMVRVHIG